MDGSSFKCGASVEPVELRSIFGKYLEASNDRLFSGTSLFSL